MPRASHSIFRRKARRPRRPHRPQCDRHQAAAGFTVLEVLVAIALLASALSAIYGLQQSASRAALSVERAQEKLETDRLIRAFVRTLNPSLQPEGEVKLGDATVRWRSEPIMASRAIITTSGQSGRFTAQRYIVHLQVQLIEKQIKNYRIETFGWQPTRPFNPFG